MKVTRRSRLQVRLQNLLFIALFLGCLGLLAWLSTQYVYRADWTASGRNTLAPATTKLLAILDKPVTITAYATTENEVLRKRISDIVARYQRVKPTINLAFVNPNTDPERTRKEGISADGELVIAYDGRTEKLQDLSEQGLTNTLQRLARQGQRWIAFIQGHGERDPQGQANHDLGNFSSELTKRGFTLQTVNLVTTPTVPDNTHALVIAGPAVNLLPGEVQLIQDYVNTGGNLLWLGDPGPLHGLEPLAQKLGVELLPGVVVDTTTQLFGIDNPAFALVVEYPPHAITRNFANLTLFPQAIALEAKAPQGWQSTPFLQTLPRSWTETGPMEGEISPDTNSGERRGPLTLGVAMTRASPKANAANPAKGNGKQQRVIVVGDGDFLSNAFLGNGGNLDLGLAIFNWLSSDDALLNVPAKSAIDTKLNLSRSEMAVISIGALFVIPVLLLLAGLVIWYRRRRR